MRLEAARGGERVDVEWAVDRGGRLWLLQVRPITVLDTEAEGAPPGSWTRRIADDLWADRLDPFTAGVMLAHAPRFDLSRISRRCGIPPVQPALAVIHGYLYVNCMGIRRLVAHVPRRLRPKEIASLLPPSTRFEEIPEPRPAALIRLLLRTCRLPFHEPGSIPPICLALARRNIRRIRARLRGAGARPRSAADRLSAVMETLAEVQEGNQWPYFHATVLAWSLRAVAAGVFRVPGAELLSLIGRGSDNVTIRIERWFRSMAVRIGSEPERRRRFAEEGAPALTPDQKADLEHFLERYGCRSRHRTLLVPRWAESPSDAVAMLQALVRSQVSTKKATAPARVNPFLQASASFVRRFFDLREELRFLLDQVLYRLRRDLLELGRELGLGENIFFLPPERVRELAAGRLPPERALSEALARRRRFEREVEPAVFWVDGTAEDELTPGAIVLKGLGTSPGRVSGRAVLVDDPGRADIRRGDIVVARHTDPGWTPIMSVIGGIITEEGGLLNHCSIVARELGVPSIVGVRRATRLIPAGAHVTLDGASGLVTIGQDPS
jgi:pyruvate,water dikinase